MQILKDKLLIKVDKEYDDEVKVGGVNLQLDTSYEKTHHVRIYGDVVSTPRGITVYAKGGNAVREIAPFDSIYDVQIGDRVYFHFHTVKPANRLDNYVQHTDFELAELLNDFTEEEIAHLYVLDHRQLFCAVRDGRIIMQADRVLVQPKLEPWENCVTKGCRLIYKVPEPKSWDDIEIEGFGLVTKPMPEPIPRVAIVKHAGKPGKGFQQELHPGDEIYLSPDSEFKNTIEGVEYYVCRQSDIIGKYINN